MFILRAAFWLSVVVLLLPGDPNSGTNAPRVSAVDEHHGVEVSREEQAGGESRRSAANDRHVESRAHCRDMWQETSRYRTMPGGSR